MADEEDRKELTAKQKKSKKKKEAAKRKKEQKQKEPDIKEEEEETETSQTPKEKFQQELNWCIENMELGLMTQRSDKKQATHTVHLIKSLKSDKTPLPRKRQIMFSMFGDYRKKMKDVQNRIQEPAQNAAISSVKAAEQKCKFLRTCHNSRQDSTECEELENSSTRHSWTFVMSDNSFRFGFDKCLS